MQSHNPNIYEGKENIPPPDNIPVSHININNLKPKVTYGNKAKTQMINYSPTKGAFAKEQLGPLINQMQEMTVNPANQEENSEDEDVDDDIIINEDLESEISQIIGLIKNPNFPQINKENFLRGLVPDKQFFVEPQKLNEILEYWNNTLFVRKRRQLEWNVNRNTFNYLCYMLFHFKEDAQIIFRFADELVPYLTQREGYYIATSEMMNVFLTFSGDPRTLYYDVCWHDSMLILLQHLMEFY